VSKGFTRRTSPADQTTKKAPAEVQLDEGQTIQNPEKEPIMFNASPTIADTTDTQVAPFSEDGTITIACTDVGCLKREHTLVAGDGYFHIAFLEQSDKLTLNGEVWWIVAAERLDSEPEWSICAQSEDDMTPDDSLACATAMLHASVRAGLLNGKGI